MLNAKRIDEVFRECLFSKDEDTSNMVKVEGITMTVGFNPNRLETYREEIESYAKEVPKGFTNGMSFVHLCESDNGSMWTGLHQDMELLMLLLMAVGKMEYTHTREFWKILPMGVPALRLIG